MYKYIYIYTWSTNYIDVFFLGFLLFLVEDQQFLFQTRFWVSYCCALVLFLLRFGVVFFGCVSPLLACVMFLVPKKDIEWRSRYILYTIYSFSTPEFWFQQLPHQKIKIKISQQTNGSRCTSRKGRSCNRSLSFTSPG